jgi:hypothetical protein
MGKVIDKIRAKRANNSVITAEDSSFQVGNEEPQEANVVSNTTEQEKKTKPINTEIPQVDLSHEANPVISVGDFNNKEQEANTQKDFFGLENSLSNWQKPNVPQGDIPDESKLTIVEDIKNNKELKSTTTPSESQAIYNMYMDSVIERAKGMEGGLTSENIQKAQQELSVPRLKQSSLDTNITFEEKKEEQPKTAETPQATEEKKQFGDDWLYEFSKINPKPNVLSDLGFHGFEKHSVPDNLLNLWGKDLKGAIDDIKDENGNSLTDEQKKKILRRIRGVRAGQALMQIANIATQAAAVSQGGTPVKMDNSSILGKIHNQAQAKQDAWLKQAIKAKETANKDKMDMLNYQLDWMKYQNDLQGKINDANIKKAQLALDAEKAEIDRQYKERLLNNAQYRAETARIKANKEAVEKGDENTIKEINANAKLRDDFKVIKTKDGTVVIPYANLEQIYSELSKLEPNNQGDGETSNQSDAYSTSIGGNTKDVKTKLLGAVTSLINKHGYDKIKKYMVNDKATAERVLKAYGRGNKIYFNTGD